MVRARSLPSISSWSHAATYQQFIRNICRLLEPQFTSARRGNGIWLVRSCRSRYASDVTARRHSTVMWKIMAFVALAAASASAAVPEERWGIDDSVKVKVVALLDESKPLKPLARTLQTEEIKMRGRFGKKLSHARSLYI